MGEDQGVISADEVVLGVSKFQKVCCSEESCITALINLLPLHLNTKFNEKNYPQDIKCENIALYM